jgi:hypothetical protein
MIRAMHRRRVRADREGGSNNGRERWRCAPPLMLSIRRLGRFTPRTVTAVVQGLQELFAE